MAKNKIETNKEDLFDGNEETDIINIISKQNFMNWLEINGFSEKQIKQFFQEKRISSIEQNRFNILLRKAKKETGISIVEIVLYLENSVVKLKKIISILDEDTFHILKHELASKFKIKIDKNMLYKILE
jgi:hypothetical protein